MFYKNIQGLRGIASLMVVFAHSYWFLLPMREHWSMPFVDSIAPGGVDLFFVISGFVVFLSADRLAKKAEIVGRWRSFREFGVRRLLRIYPVYWVAFASASILMTRFEVVQAGMPEKSLWELLFLFGWQNNRIVVVWTLQFEMCFYVICALSILIFPRRALFILAVWFAAVFATWAYDMTAQSVWVNSIVLEFAFGIIVALLARRKFSEYAVSSVAAGIGGLLVGAPYFRINGGWSLPFMWRVMCFGLPSAFIVYGLVAVEIRQMWTFSRGWTRFGDTSYSLYLWHFPLFGVMAAFCVKLGLLETVPAPVLAVFSGVAAIAVGYISFHQIERRFNEAKWVGRLAGVEPKKPVAVPTSAGTDVAAIAA